METLYPFFSSAFYIFTKSMVPLSKSEAISPNVPDDYFMTQLDVLNSLNLQQLSA